eukprot:1953825-Rhodomonas_salina.1
MRVAVATTTTRVRVKRNTPIRYSSTRFRTRPPMPLRGPCPDFRSITRYPISISRERACAELGKNGASTCFVRAGFPVHQVLGVRSSLDQVNYTLLSLPHRRLDEAGGVHASFWGWELRERTTPWFALVSLVKKHVEYTVASCKLQQCRPVQKQ